MEFKILVVALAALVPMFVGFFWYGPLLFQKAWMQTVGFTEDSMKGANMLLIFGLSYVFSFLVAFFLQSIVIHQMGIYSVLISEPGFAEGTGEAYTVYQDFMASYGSHFRSFKHGALHGVLISLFFVLPVLGTNALFERKGFKYIAINVGYWTVSLALMGGIVCQYM